MKAEILSNQRVSDQYYKMELGCPELTDEIKPGQFLMLKVKPGYEPYLRRPFSFYGIGSLRDQRSFEILYKVVGSGTRLLAELKHGERVDIIAPLGNGFSFFSDTPEAVMVAGGIGLPPLLYLAEYMRKNRKEGSKTIFLYGGQSKSDMIDIERIRDASSEARVCTEDGSLGEKMLVTELLELHLQRRGDWSSIQIFSCGPKAMLRVVSSIAKKYDISCQVSLESYMACGFGVCLGCVVKVMQEEGMDVTYERVCKEGPVFESKRIIWDE
jgi:dihydroorotate dehydrogenase electron transfer subunit